MCRFINADGYASTGQGFIGYNMFAYCNNNPTNLADPSGGLACQTSVRMSNDGGGCYSNNGNTNSDNNRAADELPSTTTKNRIINNQNTECTTFCYGNYPASYNGCGAIAVHNVKVIKGMDSSLSETLDTFSESGAMWLNGYFGSKPSKIGNVLDSYGISYSMSAIDRMTEKGEYIVSYLNSNVIGGIHTIAVSYDGQDYVAYNYKGGRDECFNPASLYYLAFKVYYIP